MKALVTGASGLIGSHLVEALEKRGNKVYRLSLRGDDFDWGKEQPDYIFHLAAYGNMSQQKDDSEMFVANLEKTFILLNAVSDVPYKSFINTSSSSVTLPHQTMYAATKLGAEALCKAFADEYRKPIVSLRPYSVYGEGEASFRFIPTVFRSCMTGEPMILAPEAVHDWVYVGDVVDTYLQVADNAEALKGKSIGIGTGIKTTNKNVVKMIESITKRKATIKHTNTLRSFDSNDWVCQTPLPHYTSLLKGLEKYYESIK